MTDPSAIDLGEEVVALAGIGHFLSRSPKLVRIYKNTPRLAADIDETAREFVNGKGDDEKGTAAKELPPVTSIDYDEMSGWLVDKRPPDVSSLSTLPHELARAGVAVAARVKNYLAGIFPRETITTMASTREVKPSDLKIEKFRRVYGVAEDVRTVFRALLDGTLTKDQAAAFQLMFPTTFRALKMAILGEIAVKLGANPGWTLTYARDQLLQSVTMTSIDNPGAAKRLQQNFQVAKAAVPASTPTQTAALTATQTPVQRASK